MDTVPGARGRDTVRNGQSTDLGRSEKCRRVGGEDVFLHSELRGRRDRVLQGTKSDAWCWKLKLVESNTANSCFLYSPYSKDLKDMPVWLTSY